MKKRGFITKGIASIFALALLVIVYNSDVYAETTRDIDDFLRIVEEIAQERPAVIVPFGADELTVQSILFNDVMQNVFMEAHNREILEGSFNGTFTTTG
ncbi:MAG: hypothetical protein FWC69_06485, partial [Defluviitaleaceae bacterium]|nr:hypothetical protein [Defluviitaleaceae bacterium]